MGMGTRKIRQSEAAALGEPQSAVSQNSSAYNDLSGFLDGFINQSKLQGAGWDSAKKLANIYKTIDQTFVMVSDQLTDANSKVISGQANLLDSQIDEEALKNQMLQNQATMTQLAYASTLWNSTNPGQVNPSSNAQRNLQTSIGNENAEIQKTLDSMNDFDLSTKYAYDDLQQSIDNLAKLISQVSNSANTYDSKTGLFTTAHIDMKLVSTLNGKVKKYEDNLLKTNVNDQAKTLLDLYKKYEGYDHDFYDNAAKLLKTNPKELIELLLENEKFVESMLYSKNKEVTKQFLRVFGGLEVTEGFIDNLSKTSAKYAVEKVFNSSEFAKFADKLPVTIQEKVLNKMIKLESDGWNILAPVAHFSETLGAFGLAKPAVVVLEKLKNSETFMKVLKVAGPALTAANIATDALDEFSNPNSKAYGNMDKAIYGGMVRYALELGPVEGGEYGAIIGSVFPGAGNVIGGGVGFLAGSANTAYQTWGDRKFKDKILDWAYEQYDDGQKQKQMLDNLNNAGLGNLGDKLAHPDYGELFAQAGV